MLGETLALLLGYRHNVPIVFETHANYGIGRAAPGLNLNPFFFYFTMSLLSQVLSIKFTEVMRPKVCAG